MIELISICAIILVYCIALMPFFRKLLKPWIGYDLYEKYRAALDVLSAFAAIGAFVLLCGLFTFISEVS